MNEKETLNKQRGILLDKDEIITLTGSGEGGWDWVEDAFSGKSEGEILMELNKMWPHEDNEYLAWSISEQL